MIMLILTNALLAVLLWGGALPLMAKTTSRNRPLKLFFVGAMFGAICLYSRANYFRYLSEHYESLAPHRTSNGGISVMLTFDIPPVPSSAIYCYNSMIVAGGLAFAFWLAALAAYGTQKLRMRFAWTTPVWEQPAPNLPPAEGFWPKRSWSPPANAQYSAAR